MLDVQGVLLQFIEQMLYTFFISDVEQCLADFKGGHFSLSMSSTYMPGGKKKGENGAWRKVSTSPRKKSNLNSSWSQDEVRQEGNLVSRMGYTLHYQGSFCRCKFHNKLWE